METKNSFLVKGNLVTCDSNRDLKILEDGYLFVLDGKVQGRLKEIPPLYSSLPLYDRGKDLILPGFSDLHVHASQYAYRGVGGDCELLEWLGRYAFPEEKKFKDPAYAKQAYSIFVSDLKKSFTTRASIFATIHKDATIELARQLEEAKIPCYVGRLSRNRNSPDDYVQKDTATGLKDIEDYILERKKFSLEKPILTPRFTPSVTKNYRKGLGKLRDKYDLKVQSHLDENPSEISWVKELEPWAESYSETYDTFHRLGKGYDCIRAHCIYNSEKEIQRLKDNGVFVAHCPDSNLNVASGIAPVKRYLEKGIKVGLGSDVAGGCSLNLFKAGRQARQLSKRYFRYLDKTCGCLYTKDVFARATIIGGSFFGKTGAFLDGYDADILVIDDSGLASTLNRSVLERLERLFYLSDENRLKLKFVKGVKILG